MGLHRVEVAAGGGRVEIPQTMYQTPGGVVVKDSALPPPADGVVITELPLSEEMRAARLAAINATYQAEFAALEQQYPRAEREGWTLQLREADAYESGNGPTPCLSAMLAQRNEGAEVPETMPELIGKIRGKSDAYATLYGALTGKRHRLERAALTAETPEQLALVVW